MRKKSSNLTLQNIINALKSIKNKSGIVAIFISLLPKQMKSNQFFQKFSNTPFNFYYNLKVKFLFPKQQQLNILRNLNYVCF